MKKILFIIKNKNEASSRFRVLAYFEKLEKNFSIYVFYSEYHNIKIPKILRSIIKRFYYLVLLWRIKQYDVIYMQRPMSSDKSTSVLFEKLLVSRNKNLIFDYDDALFITNKEKITKLISMAKICICGNKYLYDYSVRYNQNTYIIPTAIDEKKFTPKVNRNDESITIGWTGTSGNYQFFSKKMIDEINVLLNNYEHVKFLFICDKQPDKRFTFPYEFIAWNEKTEVADLQNIDIGLMPLKDSAWSRGKCGFKLIQYGAIGIPSVASDVGVNSEVIVDNKTGILVSNDDWNAPLERLIKSPALCSEMGERATRHISKKYSLDVNYEKLVSAINLLTDK